jgi:hypothetical protein
MIASDTAEIIGAAPAKAAAEVHPKPRAKSTASIVAA